MDHSTQTQEHTDSMRNDVLSLRLNWGNARDKPIKALYSEYSTFTHLSNDQCHFLNTNGNQHKARNVIIACHTERHLRRSNYQGDMLLEVERLCRPYDAIFWAEQGIANCRHELERLDRRFLTSWPLYRLVHEICIISEEEGASPKPCSLSDIARYLSSGNNSRSPGGGSPSPSSTVRDLLSEQNPSDDLLLNFDPMPTSEGGAVHTFGKVLSHDQQSPARSDTSAMDHISQPNTPASTRTAFNSPRQSDGSPFSIGSTATSATTFFLNTHKPNDNLTNTSMYSRVDLSKSQGLRSSAWAASIPGQPSPASPSGSGRSSVSSVSSRLSRLSRLSGSSGSSGLVHSRWANPEFIEPVEPLFRVDRRHARYRSAEQQSPHVSTTFNDAVESVTQQMPDTEMSGGHSPLTSSSPAQSHPNKTLFEHNDGSRSSLLPPFPDTDYVDDLRISCAQLYVFRIRFPQWYNVLQPSIIKNRPTWNAIVTMGYQYWAEQRVSYPVHWTDWTAGEGQCLHPEIEAIFEKMRGDLAMDLAASREKREQVKISDKCLDEQLAFQI